MKKPKIDKNTIKRLFKYLSSYKLSLTLVIICIIINSVTSMLSSVFLKRVVDNYIMPLLGTNNPNFKPLLNFLSIIAIVYIVALFSSYFYNRTMGIVAEKVIRDIRCDMFKKMQYLEVKFFDTNSHGDIMSRYTNDTDTLNQLIASALPGFLSCIITLVSIFVAMISLSLPLTIFTIIGGTFIIIITKYVTKKSSKYFLNQQESIGKVNGFIEEMISGSKVIKVFTHEEESKHDFDKLNNELERNMFRANKYSSILMPLIHSLGNIEYVLVAIVGSILILKFDIKISLGTLIGFLSLSKALHHPIGEISSQVNTVIMSLAGASRIFELMDNKAEVDEGKVSLVNITIDKKGNIKESSKETNHWAWKVPTETGFDYVELQGKVEINNVTFAYDQDIILHDISLYAKSGQKIAFVGSTGAGKTTITNLLNRFYDINEGEILYDGINIKDIKKYDLRRSLGMVLQDTYLFTGTIKDNIRYGKKDATDEEIIKVCKIANAHEFIKLLPDGYDTIIDGSGANLSEGQRQLLAIARALINNPPVLVLDEATSSIDTRTEFLVQDGMDKLMEGRTVFVIAHRLSTIRNAKAILLLEHGEIVERGEHSELMKQRGRYYKLYTGMFELE